MRRNPGGAGKGIPGRAGERTPGTADERTPAAAGKRDGGGCGTGVVGRVPAADRLARRVPAAGQFAGRRMSPYRNLPKMKAPVRQKSPMLPHRIGFAMSMFDTLMSALEIVARPAWSAASMP